MGMEAGRTVTVLRLPGSNLIVHSTGPFSEADVSKINALGKVRWLVDVTFFHDTFAREGSTAFPNAEYLAPKGFFPKVETFSLHAPPEWRGEVEVLELAGMPSVREHAMWHRESRTLILADALFNWQREANLWARFLRRYALGLTEAPQMSRFFKAAIKARNAFQNSVDTIFKWDFDRVIVAHGAIIEQDGKRALTAAFSRAGFSPP